MENPKHTRKKLEQKKQQAEQLYLNGMFQKDIAKQLNISPQTVCKWLKLFKKNKGSMKRIKAELINRIEKAVMNKADSSEIRRLINSYEDIKRLFG